MLLRHSFFTSFPPPTPRLIFKIKMDIATYFIELHRQEKELEEKLRKTRVAIRAHQEICNHDYKRIGNTHKDIYQCKICMHRTAD